MSRGISIEGDAVDRVVKTILETKIAEALGGEGHLVQTLITKVLDQEIDMSGGRYGGSGGTPTTFLRRTIQEAVAACIQREIRQVVLADSSGVQDRIRELLKEKHVDLIKRIAGMKMAFSEDYEDKFEIFIKFDKNDSD